MAAITTPPPTPAPTGPRRDGLGEWRAGWRVALRLARRDVRRHVGRSLLIILMVAVPVLLLVGGNIIFSSQDLTSAERIPYFMGQTQAHVSYSSGPVVPAQVDPWHGYYGGVITEEKPEKTVPGWGADLSAHATALGALVGGTAIPVTDGAGFTTIGRKQIELTLRGVDAAAFPAQTAGIVRLVSGRWPTSTSEVVVTNVGLHHGLPSSGTVAVTDRSGTVRTYTIVGVGQGWIATYNLAAVDLITLPAMDSQDSGSAAYLIDRPTPVTWDEVKRLATYGLQVTSRQVILNPPSREELALPDDVQSMADQAAFGQAITSAIMAIGLLLETTLLVGPAFAVSAARQRRTLALAASNGATTAQLRRTVLAQALVLGVLAALVGAVAGVLGVKAVITWSDAYRPDTVFGPFDVPVLPVSIIVGCAVISAVIAALIPARGLGRLDIVGVMRGQSVSPRALVRTPIAGIVLASLGAVGVFWAVTYTSPESTWVYQVVPLVAMVGAILLVIGTLLLVPMVLVLAARLARPAPVAIRMAMRDAARQRGRATSTVAAILGGTALLSTILVVAASDSAYRGRYYVPQLPMGQAKLIPAPMMNTGQVEPHWAQNVTDIVRGIDPALQVRTHSVVDVTGSRNAVQKPNEPTDTTSVPFFVAVRTGCTPAKALDMGAPTSPDTPPDSSCLSLRGMGMGDGRSGILVGSLADLVQTYGLDATAEATLRAGGIVVAGDKGSSPTWTTSPDGGWGTSGPMLGQVDIVDGRVSFARGTANYGANAGPTLTDVTTLSLAATAVPAATLNSGAMATVGTYYGGQEMIGALLTTETATSLALPTTVLETTIIDPRGPLSTDDEAELETSAADNNLGWLYVERGFQPYDRLLALIVLSFIGLIILVATLVSTALSTAETQSMMGTFAAVGATRMTRRNLAAAQAGSLGVIGALLGTLVGFVPGIAIARASTRYPMSLGSYDAAGAQSLVDPTVVIPWLQLAIPVLAVPALAALLAWLAIRRAPTVTRRLT
jgi:putative ABC transport system permease protein